MLAFELSINGKTVQKVGVGELGVLSAGVQGHRLEATINERMTLHSSGHDIAKDRHIAWPKHDLLPGDVVSIRVVDEDDFSSDAPTRIAPSPHFD